MDQHAVPQNISSYEFRLVGDMTLKQFFQLAGGILVGLIFYKTPFPFFIKWPLVGLSVLIGIMLAFVPVGGRPFSQWLLAFIKAIYSPTRFEWKASLALATPAPRPETPIKKTSTTLDVLEEQLFSRFSQIFNQSPVTTAPIQQTEYVKMDVVVVPPPSSPPLPPPPAPQVVPEAKVVEVPNEPVKIAKLAQVMTHDKVPARISVLPAAKMPTPEQANILTGQVLGTLGIPVDGAIIEILDNVTNSPVRALRTNRLGQFLIATPLPAGEYTLITDKFGYVFDPLLVKVPNAIVPPILITSKDYEG